MSGQGFLSRFEFSVVANVEKTLHMRRKTKT